MTAYIKSLQRRFASEAIEDHATEPDLEQRFIEWFNSVPEVSRFRRYSMVELEKALETQGRFLGPILASLGWERRRVWSSNGPNLRYWMPPSFSN